MYRMIPKYIETIVIKTVVPVQHDIDCIAFTPIKRRAEFNSNGNLGENGRKLITSKFISLFSPTKRYCNVSSMIESNKCSRPNYKKRPKTGRIHT